MGSWGIALIPAVFSLAALAASFLVWRKSEQIAEQIRSTREGPQKELADIASLLKFEGVAPASQRDRSGRAVLKSRTTESKATNPLLTKVERVQNALQVLRSNAERYASQIPDGAELQTLSQQIRFGMGSQQPRAAEQELLEFTRRAVKIALSSSDRDIDPDRMNSQVQQALLDLCDVARCQFIDPKENDEFVDAEHRASGSTVRPPHDGLRSKIASVSARGLRTEEGRLIAQAEVSVYD